jgi:hypothetical protein
MRLFYRPPANFHQLCAIARVALLQEPTQTDADWREETRVLVARRGYAEPPSDQLARVLGAVERSLRQTLGPRPATLSSGRSLTPPHDLPPERRTPSPQGWAVVQGLLARLATSPVSDGSSAPTVEWLEVSEAEALHEFWHAVRDGIDPVRLLKTFAEIAIVRPIEWDYAAVRAAAGDHTLAANGCFGCRTAGRVIQWHHVIQVQHGGSNTPRNRVAICAACHHAIHPWLRPARVTSTGFVRLAVIAEAFVAPQAHRRSA